MILAKCTVTFDSGDDLSWNDEVVFRTREFPASREEAAEKMVSYINSMERRNVAPFNDRKIRTVTVEIF